MDEKQLIIKGAVFDMDGLLLDTERVVSNSWERAAEMVGFQDIERAKLACLGLNRASTEQYLREHYGATLDHMEFLTIARRFSHEVLDVHVPVKEGAAEILQLLKDKGIALAVASSTREVTVRDQLHRARLLHYFDAVVTGDMVTNGKPHPEIYLKACDTLGLIPEECLALEDSVNGIRSASAAGLHPIQIPDQVPATAETMQLSWRIYDSLTAAMEELSAFLIKYE